MQTRLVILDHFMLDGVKALFKFTMAILHEAFQTTPPSSCEVLMTIRDVARDLNDTKRLLAVVRRIKLPKDSYFAIRRSFYMVQASFSSDQFYIQSLTNDASRQMHSNRPLNVQRLPNTKQPCVSLVGAASLLNRQSFIGFNEQRGMAAHNNGRPRVCISADRSKVCIQNIGRLGRSHIRIIDAHVRTNERSLMSPLRNTCVLGLTNCGKNIVLARQSSRKNYKVFREQDFTFHVHELSHEIFDGFYLEQQHLVVILTTLGDIYKIDVNKCFVDSQTGSTENLSLRDTNSIGERDKVKLRVASVDVLTNLLWVYVECEDVAQPDERRLSEDYLQAAQVAAQKFKSKLSNRRQSVQRTGPPHNALLESQKSRVVQHRIVAIVDITSFDVFSWFTVPPSLGSIMQMRTALVSFCHFANPMSNNQTSSRIVRLAPTGNFEHLLSLSDLVDYLVIVTSPQCDESQRHNTDAQSNICTHDNLVEIAVDKLKEQQRQLQCEQRHHSDSSDTSRTGALARYCSSLLRRNSTTSSDREIASISSGLMSSSSIKTLDVVSEKCGSRASSLQMNDSDELTACTTSGISSNAHSSGV